MNGMRGFEAPQCSLPPGLCLRRSGTRGVGSSLGTYWACLISLSPLQMYSFDAPNELITAYPLVLVPVFGRCRSPCPISA